MATDADSLEVWARVLPVGQVLEISKGAEDVRLTVLDLTGPVLVRNSEKARRADAVPAAAAKLLAWLKSNAHA